MSYFKTGSQITKTEYHYGFKFLHRYEVINEELILVRVFSLNHEFTKDIQENGYNIFIKNDEGEIMNVKINPSVSKRLEVAREMRAAASMIGISLDSRIKIVAPKKNEVVEDPMDEFFN